MTNNKHFKSNNLNEMYESIIELLKLINQKIEYIHSHYRILDHNYLEKLEKTEILYYIGNNPYPIQCRIISNHIMLDSSTDYKKVYTVSTNLNSKYSKFKLKLYEIFNLNNIIKTEYYYNCEFGVNLFSNLETAEEYIVLKKTSIFLNSLLYVVFTEK